MREEGERERGSPPTHKAVDLCSPTPLSRSNPNPHIPTPFFAVPPQAWSAFLLLRVDLAGMADMASASRRLRVMGDVFVLWLKFTQVRGGGGGRRVRGLWRVCSGSISHR